MEAAFGCNAANTISEINTELNSSSLKRANLIGMQSAPLFVILVLPKVVSNVQGGILICNFKEFWDE